MTQSIQQTREKLRINFAKEERGITEGGLRGNYYTYLNYCKCDSHAGESGLYKDRYVTYLENEVWNLKK